MRDVRDVLLGSETEQLGMPRGHSGGRACSGVPWLTEHAVLKAYARNNASRTGQGAKKIGSAYSGIRSGPGLPFNQHTSGVGSGI